MAKQGFGGQWIEVAKVGRAIDSEGVEHNLTPHLLASIVANFNAGADEFEAPLTIGHPKHGDPAYGWISKLRMNGDRVEMQTQDTEDQFENMVKDGRFRTRSSGIVLKHPTLKSPTIDHVAFLGAQPPGVKGLRKIEFTEAADGESFTVEENFNLQETKMKDEDFDQLPESAWDKIKMKLGLVEKKPEAGEAAVQFTEGNVKKLVADAIESAKDEITADFTEKLKAKDVELAALRTTVDAGTASGRRSEIVSFVESIPAEKGKHFLKRAGVVEFMESLDVADSADTAPAILFSEGEGDKKEDHKFSRLDWFKNYVNAQKSFVEFGEKFGNLVATREADGSINTDRVKKMKTAAGIAEKKETTGGKD